MTEQTLAQAVNRFAQVTQALPDAELERAWAWGSYDSEGIRFACFRTFEELRELAVKLRQARPAGAAQQILGYYHAAYADLQGALVGLAAEDFERIPVEGEWPLRKTLGHIFGADLGFYVVVAYALERARGRQDLPAEISDPDWDRISGLDEAAYRALLAGSIDDLRAVFAERHAGILAAFAGITAAELEQPSMYWEKEAMPVRFRLHRFESHLRQHTIQVDKTLAALHLLPSEARRLLRLIFGALADVESAQIGAPELGAAECAALAQAIAARADEIAAILASG